MSSRRWNLTPSADDTGGDRVARRRFWLWRLPMLLLVALLLLVVGWRTAFRIEEFDEQMPSVGVAVIENGRFLGLTLHDHTRDRFAENVWLRLAMNEGFSAAGTVRRFQMEAIRLQEGQHPETGEPAVLVTIEPKEFEMPDPPFATIAVRRGKPRSEVVMQADDRREKQRNLSPNEEDLVQLRQSWSGNRFAEVDALFRGVRRLLIGVVVGLGFLFLAGAYRTFAWQTSRWDVLEDRARSDSALGSFHAARGVRREQARSDS